MASFMLEWLMCVIFFAQGLIWFLFVKNKFYRYLGAKVWENSSSFFLWFSSFLALNYKEFCLLE